jgi:hypothetical protein
MESVLEEWNQEAGTQKQFLANSRKQFHERFARTEERSATK